VAKKRQVRAALNNSFGFGGTNASLIVKAVD
jgi:3-oxoacyl-[acyl-carrier-protein] synthase II